MNKLTSKIINLKNNYFLYEKQFLETLQVYVNAHQFVQKNNFKKYLLISGFAFLLLFTIIIKLILSGVESSQEPLTKWLLPYLQKYLTLNPEDIKNGIKGLFWLIKKAIESNKDAIFSTVFLIIGTPFFSFISSKTEEIITGKTYAFHWSGFVKELKRGLNLSIRNSLKQWGLIFIITIIALIPLIDIFTPLITFIIQAFFNGILMTDYTLERQGFSAKNSEIFYNQHKPEMFAIGLGFMFLLLIPVIGWFIAPTYGIVASYLYFTSVESNHKK